MQRYFSNQKIDNNFILDKSDLRHIKTVMRMKNNDLVEVVYQNKLFIASINNDNIKLEKETNDIINYKKINLIIPLLKEQKMDLIIQKAVELGVFEITLYKAERSIIKLDEKKLQTKLSRWSKIAKEAAEQSKRLDIPSIKGLFNINDLKYNELSLICSTNEKQKNIKKVLQSNKNYDKINILVGPEGGLSINEEELLIKNKFEKITLGDRILRVETVPIFLLSVINYESME